MSVPSSWAIRNEKLGGRKVDKYGKGDPGASQSGWTSQICGSIGAGLGRVDHKGVTVASGQSSYVGRGSSLLGFRDCSRGLQDLLNIKASSLLMLWGCSCIVYSFLVTTQHEPFDFGTVSHQIWYKNAVLTWLMFCSFFHPTVVINRQMKHLPSKNQCESCGCFWSLKWKFTNAGQWPGC